MKASARSQRSTQTHSPAGYLREKKCSPLLPGVEGRGGGGEPVAAWGWRRLTMLFRSRLLKVIAGALCRSRPMPAALKTVSVALATGLALAHSPATARAADIVFTPFVALLEDIDVGWNSTPTFVDIDGDGDLDVFVGEYYGAVRYFKNTGSTTAPVFSEQTGAANPFDGVDAGWNSTPTFVDIDGDGDLDAFIGEYYGTVKYFRNTGSKTVPVLVEQTGAANPLNGVDVGFFSTPTFADIDGDGDQDAFIGEGTGTVAYFRNTGTSGAPVLAQQIGAANPLNGVDVGYNSTPAFVDIDGDGDLDAFLGEYYGTVRYFRNTGTSGAPVFAEQIGAANPLNGIDVGGAVQGYSAPAFADIDGDGDLDAFLGEYYGTVHSFRNNGTAAAPGFTRWADPAVPLSGVDVGTYSAPAFADIDGDGDLDAFIGEYYGTVKYFRNTGSARNPVLVEQTGAANPFNGVDAGWNGTPAFVDIDGDGDLDAFLGEYSGTVKYFRNTGSKTVPVLTEQLGAANPLNGVDVGSNSTPVFVDIDGDGDLDAFIGEFYGTVRYFRNTGGKTVPVLTEQLGATNPLNGFDVGLNSAPTFADIDGDGDRDAFIGEFDGPVKYFRNETRKFPWAMFLPAIIGRGR